MTANKQLNCIIIEDEPNAQFVLAAMINKYLSNLEVIGRAKSVREGYTLINKLNPDLIFLDIELLDGNGFDLLNKFENLKSAVIFTTAFDNYAIQAIKFNAFDYLLKPLDFLELIECYKRYQKKEVRNEFSKLFHNYRHNMNQPNAMQKRIVIPQNQTKKYVQVNDIKFCTAENSYTWINLNSTDEKIISSKNLGEFEKLLPSESNGYESCFLRVHHKTLINSLYLKEFRSKDLELHLTTGETIKVSQRRKQVLKNFSKINL